jgi:integrase/recombinase XerD
MERQVRDFLDDLEAQLTYSDSTRLAYLNDLQCYLDYLELTLNRKPRLADFNARSVAGFLDTERESGKRPSTLLRRRASLRNFANYMRRHFEDWDERFENESHLIDEAVAVPVTATRPHYLTEHQIQALWRVLGASKRPRSRRDQAILALLLECGLTVGSLVSLNLSDIDLKSGQLHLPSNSEQLVWVPLRDALEPIQSYLKEGRPELNYRAHEPALFISQTGGRMTRQGVWQVLRQWGHKANLPVTLSPRLARHTAAYRLVSSKRPVKEIQSLLGHTNPLSTQALLRRLAPDENEEDKVD